MSRFSRSAAEKAGWTIVHEQDSSEEVRGGGQQGLVQRHPGNYRAEKSVDTHLGAKMINEQADTLGLLLEKIAAYEAFQDRLEDTSTPPEGDRVYENPYGEIPELRLNSKAKTKDGEPDNDTQLKSGDAHTDTVKTADGEFNEHDFFNRHSDEAKSAHDAFLARQRELELEKTAEPQVFDGEPQEFTTEVAPGTPIKKPRKRKARKGKSKGAK